MEKWKPLCKQDDKILEKEEEYIEKSSDDFEDYESDLEDLECLNFVKEQTVIEEDKEGNNTEMKIEKKVKNNKKLKDNIKINNKEIKDNEKAEDEHKNENNNEDKNGEQKNTDKNENYEEEKHDEEENKKKESKDNPDENKSDIKENIDNTKNGDEEETKDGEKDNDIIKNENEEDKKKETDPVKEQKEETFYFDIGYDKLYGESTKDSVPKKKMNDKKPQSNYKNINKMPFKEKFDYINGIVPPLRPLGKVVYVLESPLRFDVYFIGMVVTKTFSSNKRKTKRRNNNDQGEGGWTITYIEPTLKHYMKMDIVNPSMIIKDEPNEYYLCQYESWKPSKKVPLGSIVRPLGVSGNIDSETLCLLIEHNILPEDSPTEIEEELKEINKCMDPNSQDIIVTEEELKKRIDLRSKRIFTTDNDDTKDIDDAIHVEKISDDVYELGVHIADVTHYVKEGSILDQEAQKKSTTVYLVHKTYSMFPELLTCNICSLNSNVVRFAFSVIFRVDGNGRLIKDFEPKISKSIIKSRAKMSYSIFQGILDGKVNSNDDIPEDHKIHGIYYIYNRLYIRTI